jgi:hypothetical protein
MTPIYRWMLAATLFGSGTLTGLALANARGAAELASTPSRQTGLGTPVVRREASREVRNPLRVLRTIDTPDPTKVTFENARVAVKEITLAPGASRPSRTRETDELVLFYAESHYQAITPQGKTEPRDRQPGTVVWHKKGEVAPTLVNHGSKPVHYYSISIK